jgi:plastocyanin
MNFSRFLLLPGLLASGGSFLSAQEPVKLALRTLSAQMKYDLAELHVAPGAKVAFTFENADDIPHNVVFCDPGTDVDGLVAKMLEKPEEAVKRNFVPEDPRVWLKTGMVNPHEKQDLEFSAPKKPGLYPFVCSFPGHASSMKGVLRVLGEGGKLKDLKFALYEGSWTKLPDFTQLKPHREGAVADNLVQLNFDDYKNHYALVFTGRIEAPEPAEYTFYLASNDGSRLVVNGKELIKADGIHAAKVIQAKTSLGKGMHQVRLEYFQADKGADLFLGWKGLSFAATPLSKWTPPNWTQPVVPTKNDFIGMPLEPGERPVLYRNFIAGAGERAIGVGFPGGLNFAWSAEAMNLALAWRGAFIDAARHWNGRGGGYQAPAGFDVLRPTDLVPPLAVLETPDTQWPSLTPGTPLEGYQWKGYSLDERGVPTFHYAWRGIAVAERLESQGSFKEGTARLVRTLKFDGTPPPNAFLILARKAAFRAETDGFEVRCEKLSLAGTAAKSGLKDRTNYDNKFKLHAEGAVAKGDMLLVPLRNQIRVTYSWPKPAVHAQFPSK